MIAITDYIQNRNGKRPELLLAAGWLMFQVFLLIKTGVYTDFEAKKYVIEAGYFLENGGFSEQKYIFYALTTLLVALSLKLTGGFLLAATVQIIVNGFATIWLYKASMAISRNNLFIARLTTALFIFFFPIQMWNSYLYTESIFISVTIGLSSVVLSSTTVTPKRLLLILLALIAVIISRPFGMLFIPPVVLFVLWSMKKQRWMAWIFAAAGFYGMYLMLNYAFGSGNEMDAMKPFVEEHILCFIPSVTKPAQLDLLNGNNDANDIIYYVVHNPAHFAKLCSLRLLSFFNLYRPQYSGAHNLYLIAIMIVTYIAALIGIRPFTKAAVKTQSIYLFSLIILYCGATTLQCDDYHSRFTMVMYPYFFMLASFGIYRLFGKKILA